MASQGDELEDDAELLCRWNESEWIGQSKRYSSPPPVVLAARRQVLALTPAEKILLPDPLLAISDLVHLQLPPQPSVLTFEKAHTAFSQDAPTETLCSRDFRERPIPAPAYIAKLHQAFGQAWYDGAQSVQDSRYKFSRLPLNVLSYWHDMSQAVRQRAEWAKSVSWVESSVERLKDEGLERNVRGILDKLAWTRELRAGDVHTPAENLARLLSNRWLDDELVNMLATDLSLRLAPASECAVTTLYFTHGILASYNQEARQHTSLLRRYSSRALEGSLKRLYFPAHIDSNHWIAFCIDFESESISYGDSLEPNRDAKPSKETSRLLKAVARWVKTSLNKVFRKKGNSLAHGIQKDGTSCGVCVVNTIAHHVLGDALFEHHNRDPERLRLEYFVRLGQRALKSMEGTGSGIATQTASASTSDIPAQTLDNMSEPCATVPSGSAAVLSNTASTDPKRTSPPAKTSRPRSQGSDHSTLDNRPAKRHAPDVGETSHVIPPPASSHSPMHEIDLGMTGRRTVHLHKPKNPTTTSTHPTKPEPPSGAVGISRSATASRKLREAMDNGTYTRDPVRTETFLDDLAVLDPYAEVRDEGKHTKVLHSRCGQWYKMKGPYSTQLFADHVNKRCKAMGIKKLSSNGGLFKHVAQSVTSRAKSVSSSEQQTSQEGSKAGVAEVQGAKSKKSPIVAQAPSRTSSLLVFAKKLGWKTVPKAREEVLVTDDETTADNQQERASRSLHVTVQDRSALTGRQASPSSEGLPRLAAGPHPYACTGLTKEIKPAIEIYLRRTFTSGAGSEGPPAISRRLYGQPFNTLSKSQKKVVLATQTQGRSWRNDHTLSAVFSTACLKHVRSPSSSDPGSFACHKCRSLLKFHPFQTAVYKAIKKPTTIKYRHLNTRYQSKTLKSMLARSHGLESILLSDDPDTTVYTRFVVALAEGKISKGYPIVGDLIKALAESIDREKRGKGKQNFRYGPSLTEFANMAAIISPELYRLLSQHLPLPTIRHLKRVQSAVPRFPLTVCDATFDKVERYLKELNYTGPVALSCDDTKLHPAFRTYWDAEKKVHMLLGGTEPLAVADVEELQRVLKDPAVVKATKLRVICAQIPWYKIPPIIVAAIPIPNSLTAKDLLAMLMPILEGLLKRGIPIRSYACDGTETERSLQRHLIADAHFRHTYTIPHPHPSAEPIVVVIPVYHGHPIVMCQDAKHALKTARNNNFTGTHLLTIGNHVAIYPYQRALAFHDDSPIYNRDVEKVDRQDDNAATRLFSPITFQYLTTRTPNHVGQILYSFNMAELIVAYVNPEILHVERIKMVLRSKFFLDVWRAHLRAAGYSESRYFISREFTDIARILVDGLIGLVIVYRDHLGSATPMPLLPWLHSSEPCEHSFGEMRKLVPDFTHLEFVYSVPRLEAMLRSLARAAGYAHTYFDATKVDAANLAIFPTDAEIQQAARDAWEEAESMFALVGIVPADVLRPVSRVPTSASLPSIASWYPHGADPYTPFPRMPTHPSAAPMPSCHLPNDSESEISSDDGSESDASADSDFDAEDQDDISFKKIEQLIQAGEHAWTARQASEDDHFLNLSCAAVVLAMEDTATVQSFSEVPEKEQLQNVQEDREELQRAFQDAVRKIADQLPAEPSRPVDRPLTTFDSIDYSPLVDTRFKHETPREARSARVGRKKATQPGPVGTSDPQEHPIDATPRQTQGTAPVRRKEINRQLYDALRLQDDLDTRAGTGLSRKERWTAPGREKKTGNSANAALAAGQRASTVIARRLKTFMAHQVPEANALADAVVGIHTPATPAHSPLQEDAYGLILDDENRLLVARVLQVLCRDGSTNGTHKWQECAENIGLVSYISMQAFEHVHQNQFRGIHGQKVPTQVLTFKHLSSDNFLRLLPGSHALSPDERSLALDVRSMPIFEQFNRPSVILKLVRAVSDLEKKRRKSKKTTQVLAGNHSDSEADD